MGKSGRNGIAVPTLDDKLWNADEEHTLLTKLSINVMLKFRKQESYST